MKKYLLYIMLLCLSALASRAQNTVVQNRPYTDLRPFHFGVVVGTHFQDIEFNNIGPQIITAEDGTTMEKLITTDQDRWDNGFTVGVLGEFRLSENFAFRIAPAMYFGTKHLTFHNHTDKLENGEPIVQTQDLKSIYVSSALNLIFAAPRRNNYRPYVMTGLNPMINLSGKDEDYIKLKKYDCFFEVGMGCDFYLPFFKLRPELKFCYSLINSLDTDHASKIKDKNMLMYTNSVNEARTKMFVLSFYFE